MSCCFPGALDLKRFDETCRWDLMLIICKLLQFMMDKSDKVDWYHIERCKWWMQLKTNQKRACSRCTNQFTIMLSQSSDRIVWKSNIAGCRLRGRWWLDKITEVRHLHDGCCWKVFVIVSLLALSNRRSPNNSYLQFPTKSTDV